ncbi:hypothetical protein [Deinococcus soli (ex Cha et al. 2016)]|uniref:Uncharacterized protein n=2 Tax=Deinococcus soli (ex Cha et al. 2016) TaxID=1309411 RepID=A0AAE3XBQ7_9DEIO|nr:hypothetical protein [Deinococcus soli (ex Cha et al. 2016)]MDR6218865.1 hypothetical protein [Deinococcus soli (ex Cha et al. 2016)]MDR6328662.1 hypothetical protein [Deinococcus soli (ex Cha et al. 2016)]MDR6751851.1 hypothetical protein [Deinococcus soli (ex Cha et al. 2016)]
MITVQRSQLTFLLLPSFTGVELFTGVVLLPAHTIPQGHPGVYGLTLFDDEITVHSSFHGPNPDLVRDGVLGVAKETFTPSDLRKLQADRDAQDTGPWRFCPQSALYIKGPVMGGTLDGANIEMSVHKDALHLKLQTSGGQLISTLRGPGVELPTYTRRDGANLPRSSTRITAELDRIAANLIAQREDPDSNLARFVSDLRELHAQVTRHIEVVTHVHLTQAASNLQDFLKSTRPPL